MATKSFSVGKNHYRFQQHLGHSVQWKCIHVHGRHFLESVVTIHKVHPTRKEIIEAIERVNNRDSED